MVVLVRVAAEVTGEPLTPARALDTGQEMVRDHREQLLGDMKGKKKTERETITEYCIILMS